MNELKTRFKIFEIKRTVRLYKKSRAVMLGVIRGGKMDFASYLKGALDEGLKVKQSVEKGDGFNDEENEVKTEETVTDENADGKKSIAENNIEGEISEIDKEKVNEKLIANEEKEGTSFLIRVLNQLAAEARKAENELDLTYSHRLKSAIEILEG